MTHRIVGIWQRPYSVVPAPSLSSFCTCTTSMFPTFFTEMALSRNFSIESERMPSPSPSAAADLPQIAMNTPKRSGDRIFMMIMVWNLLDNRWRLFSHNSIQAFLFWASRYSLGRGAITMSAFYGVIGCRHE